MKNINSLVKKIEMFERLAVYGDRSAFLQSLAQEFGVNPKVKSVVEQMLSVMHKITDETITSPLRNIYFGKVDIQAITDACGKAMLDPTLLPNEKLKLQELSRQLTVAAQKSPEDTKTEKNFEQTSNKIMQSFPSIPMDVQEKLNEIAKNRMAGLFPGGIAVDGKLGPETRKALNALRAELNFGGKNDEELFQQIRAFKV